MSAQIALLAGTAALSAFSSIQAGNAKANALGMQAQGAVMQGMSADVEAAETRAAAQNEEYNRRVGLQQLLAANRADLSGRNVSGEQGSSYDVISDYNKSETDRDIGNIRFMGESKVRRLSFAREASNFQAAALTNMAGMARTSGWINAGISLGKAAIGYFGMPSFGGSSGGGMTSTQMGGPDGYGGMG